MSNAYVFDDKITGDTLIAIALTTEGVAIYTPEDLSEVKALITLSKRDLEELLELAKEE